eukprot:1787020-Heterocapsa_arctica.AAC.1
MDWLFEFFSVDGELPSGLPFFPTRTGAFVLKEHVVASIEAVVCMLGEPLADADGGRRFGGHSPRVSGA